jgi:hypothetical protein
VTVRLLRLRRETRGNPDLAAAAAVVGELPAWLGRAVTAVTAPAADQVTLKLSGSPRQATVLWGGTDRAAAKARELAVLMRSRLSYYDVSAPGSVLARLTQVSGITPIRDTLSASAWLVDPGAVRPYCPYQSYGR